MYFLSFGTYLIENIHFKQLHAIKEELHIKTGVLDNQFFTRCLLVLRRSTINMGFRPFLNSDICQINTPDIKIHYNISLKRK